MREKNFERDRRITKQRIFCERGIFVGNVSKLATWALAKNQLQGIMQALTHNFKLQDAIFLIGLNGPFRGKARNQGRNSTKGAIPIIIYLKIN